MFSVKFRIPLFDIQCLRLRATRLMWPRVYDLMDICSVIRATLASHVKSCQPLGHLTVAILRLVCLSHQVSSCCLKPCLSLCYIFNVSGTKCHRFTANKSIFPESVFLPAQTDTQKDTCTPTSYIYLGSKFKNTWCSYYMEAKYLHTLYTHALKNKVLSAVGWICLSLTTRTHHFISPGR